jgi:hypothetical protein
MIIALLLLVQTSAQQPLSLTCVGGGTANKPKTTTVWSGGESASVIGRRQQGFEDQVDLRLFAGDDRIRMPRTMLPPIRGGADGWFKLKDVQAFMNNPKVFIDRITGTVSISGKAGDYTGQCQVIDSNAPAKF